MAKVMWRQAAIDDLTDIWEYTVQKWSESQADKYYATIQLASKEIGENHDHISEDEVEIISILHERIGLKNRISE